MNPKYYTTVEEVGKVTAFLNKYGFGVKEVTAPRFVGPYRVPEVTGKEQWGLILESGVEMNAGLTLDLINRYPESFAVAMLRAMAQG